MARAAAALVLLAAAATALDLPCITCGDALAGEERGGRAANAIERTAARPSVPVAPT